MQDCSHTLAIFPQADGFYRYFFEQQLETAPSDSDWQGWKDERPGSLRHNVVQVPKFWSYGKQACLRAEPSVSFGNGDDTEENFQGRATLLS